MDRYLIIVHPTISKISKSQVGVEKKLSIICISLWQYEIWITKEIRFFWSGFRYIYQLSFEGPIFSRYCCVHKWSHIFLETWKNSYEKKQQQSLQRASSRYDEKTPYFWPVWANRQIFYFVFCLAQGNYFVRFFKTFLGNFSFCG